VAGAIVHCTSNCGDRLFSTVFISIHNGLETSSLAGTAGAEGHTILAWCD